MMLNRKIAPVNFSFTAPDIPSPEIYTLQNGLVIHSFENDDLDIIKLEFIFKNVNSFTEKVTGINLLTAKTLLAGTKNSSAEQLANQIASLGAFIDVSPSFDYTILNVYCLEKDIIDVINLIKEILENANFSEPEIKLQKNIAISNLKLQKKKNSIVASRALRKSLFSNHPYGKSPAIKDIQNVNREQISSSYQRFWKEVDVLVCGKVTNRVLTSLEGLQINKSELNDHHYANELNNLRPMRKTTAIESDSTIQTSIRIGKRIIDKKHKDYARLVMTNYILGGFFGSRLMSNLREDKGLTYGVHSSITSLRYASFFSIQCDVKSSDKTLAINEIQKELNKLANVDISDKELKVAKNHYLGSFQNSLSSVYSLSDKYKSIYFYGLQNSFYSELIRAINEVSINDLKQTASEYLTFSSMNVITVGG